jgi:hypothetical protein
MRVPPYLMLDAMPAELNGRWDMPRDTLTHLSSTTNSWISRSSPDQLGLASLLIRLVGISGRTCG